MTQEYKLWAIQTVMATVAFCVMCFGLYSCQMEESKLRAKCIEAKGTWMGQGQSGQGGCIIK